MRWKALAPLALIAASPPPAPLQPSAKWRVDFGDYQCMAIRDYAEGKGTISLAFKPSPFGDVFQILLVRKGKRSETSQQELTIQLDDQPPIKTTMLVYSPTDSRPVNTVFNLSLDGAIFAQMQKASRVRFQALPIDVALTLDSLPEVDAHLRRCIASLKELWNVGPDFEKRLKQPAKPFRPIAEQFSSEDYPHLALSRNQAGNTAAGVLIDEKGAPVDCTPRQASGIASIDLQTCLLVMERAKFTPAIGPDGNPTKGAYYFTASWRIPPSSGRRASANYKSKAQMRREECARPPEPGEVKPPC